MEAIKKIIEHSTHEVVIELPKSYQNKKLEVIVLTIEEEKKNQTRYDHSKFTVRLIGIAMLLQNKES